MYIYNMNQTVYLHVNYLLKLHVWLTSALSNWRLLWALNTSGRRMRMFRVESAFIGDGMLLKIDRWVIEVLWHSRANYFNCQWSGTRFILCFCYFLCHSYNFNYNWVQLKIYIVYNFVLKKNDTIVSVTICYDFYDNDKDVFLFFDDFRYVIFNVRVWFILI